METAELSTTYPAYQTTYEYASATSAEPAEEVNASDSAPPRSEQIDPDMGRYVNLFI